MERRGLFATLVSSLRIETTENLRTSEANFTEILDNEVLFLNEQIQHAKEELATIKQAS